MAKNKKTRERMVKLNDRLVVPFTKVVRLILLHYGEDDKAFDHMVDEMVSDLDEIGEGKLGESILTDRAELVGRAELASRSKQR